MKRILGLDLGTNSIGWALIEIDHKNGSVKIVGLGSRILPMNAGEIKDFESNGVIVSGAAQRTEYRGTRRLNERYILRRDRLHLVLNLLEALPEHYKLEIDFQRNGSRCGQFKENHEPKIAYQKISKKSNKHRFNFEDAYREMIIDIQKMAPEIRDEKGYRIPKDWTLYYLRQKALFKEISLEELSWVLLSYNQKRGYEKLEIENGDTDDEFIEKLDLKVESSVEKTEGERKYFEIKLNGVDGFTYKEYTEERLTENTDLKEITKISKVDDFGNIDPKKTEFEVTDIYQLTISDVKYEKIDGKTPHLYSIQFTNGWGYERKKQKYTPQFFSLKGKSFDYIVRTQFDSAGNIKLKQGDERKLDEPNYDSDASDDWTLLKKKTEKEALKFNHEAGFVDEENGSVKKYISPRIYNILKKDSVSGERTKIIGGMFQVVERDFYREELKQIVKTQSQFHENLHDKKIFEDCVKLLYPKNDAHSKNLLKNKDAIQNLLVEDVLLYQRPLKTKKSEIANCKYEIRHWKEEVNKDTGEIMHVPYYRKVVSVSHPLAQEFRIWDKIHNLKLIKVEDETGGEKQTNIDVTRTFFTTDEYEILFKSLNNRKFIDQKQFLKHCKERFQIKDINNYVWNYPEDEEIKGNETRTSFAVRFKRCGFSNYESFLTQSKEIELWHYLYSVNFKERTKNENTSLHSFFDTFFEGYEIDAAVKDRIVLDFANFPKFPSKYSAYSEKALKKLLPFLRIGETIEDISEEVIADIKAMDFHARNIQDYLGLTKENLATLNSSERQELEIKKQELHSAVWLHSISQRKEEILKRLEKIDFTAEEVDYSEAVDNELRLPFPKGLFNAFKNVRDQDDFRDLDLTQASYLVYGRHSELANAKYWRSPEQIRDEIHKELKQHSLNNPVAEKVIREMMQVVADVWAYYGDGAERYFSRIHLEVARDLKNSAKKKKEISDRQGGNRAQNKRIRQVLEEYLSNGKYNAQFQNPDHFERLKIAEEGAEHTKNTDKTLFDNEVLRKENVKKKDIEDILKKPHITKEDFEKYKLWIEQGYRSPYTGEIIRLTDLFNGYKYNVDHILPRASVTNNSLSNKVVCEFEINKDKSDMTGREYITKNQGREVFVSAHNKEVAILSDEAYQNLIKQQFSGTKKFILLSKDVPEGFTNSQLSSTKHIARKAMELLSHIVREEGEIEYRSKNVLPVTGMITGSLKQEWKLHQVWSELVAPRFKRLNEITKSNLFGEERISEKSGKSYFDCSLHESIREKNPDFNIKRIDHRHHALDALIVALCTDNHVNYLNNVNAGINPKKKKERMGAIKKQRSAIKRQIMFSEPTPTKEEPKQKKWHFMLPGDYRMMATSGSGEETMGKVKYQYKKKTGLTRDFKATILFALQDTIVTFKQNNRVINKTVNRYNNTPDKNKFAIQEPTVRNGNTNTKYNWAIRRSIGKKTFYGKVNLRLKESKKLYSVLDRIFDTPEIIVEKDLKKKIVSYKKGGGLAVFKMKVKSEIDNVNVNLYRFTNDTEDEKVASRESLNEKFDTNKIETITDTGIQKILKNHLKKFDTVELSFEVALNYYDALIEKVEIDAIIADKENEFSTQKEFKEYLIQNSYKFEKTDYRKLNVLIEAVKERDFRNEKDATGKVIYEVIEHPEIAFSVEEMVKMNEPETLRQLNGGKNHMPIKKVRTYTKLGEKRMVSENKLSVKHKQFIVNDAGSNLFMGVYEAEIDGQLVRKFESIKLMDLIEILKEDKNNRFHPLPEQIFDNNDNIYLRRFTLSPLDYVYMPTENERVNSKSVASKIETVEQKERIFAVNDLPGTIYFFPKNFSSPITEKEIDMKFNEKKGKTVGSYSDKTASYEGRQIKDNCWKIEIDRIGNIKKVVY